MQHLSPELIIVLLLFFLFILPRIMARLNIPGPITTFAFGILLGPIFSLDLDHSTIQLLATIGISALFLFAGLEVNLDELKNQRRILLEHVIIRFILWAGMSLTLFYIFELSFRAAGLYGLALVSPSAGFILDQIGLGDQNETQRIWIRNLAIAAEIVALFLMFFMMKSDNLMHLLFSSSVLILLVIGLPILFRAFVKYIVPFAPDSEFSFLLIMSVICGLITKKLGTYYLIGAFIVGLAAQIYRHVTPHFSSDSMLKSLKMFAGFFMPFYFYYAGVRIPGSVLTWTALFYGVLFVIVVGGIRTGVVMLHRLISLKEPISHSFPISVSLLPNLVFGLILSQVLIDENLVSPHLAGGIIFYSIGITLMPTFITLFYGSKIKGQEVDYIPGPSTVIVTVIPKKNP